MKGWKKIICLAGAAVLFLGALAACQREETPSLSGESEPSTVSESRDPNTFPQGLRIGGKDLSGKTLAEALDICRAATQEELTNMEITVRFRDDTVSLSGGDFAAKDVYELTLPRLLAGDAPQDLALSYVTDLSAGGRQKLQEAARAAYVEGQEATIVGFEDGEFVFSESQPGSRVDMLTTLRSVRQLLSQKQGGAIQASFVEVDPSVTQEELKQRFGQLSSYTTVSTNTANGNSNMALALSKVNGTVLQPGQVFSYNGTLGDSTNPDYGWKTAGGLMGNVSVQVYGGGICQGSTTLYNAALLAGMEIVERDCHSTPSTYCPIGLDATVDYGNIDFKFRNPLADPVYISSWMDGTTLYVEFYGVQPKDWDEIRVGSEQTGSTPPPNTVSFRVDNKLASGEYVRVLSGRTGYTARAWRNYYKDGELVKSENLPSSDYGAAGVVYSVGPDTDTSKVDPAKESGNVNTDASPSPSVSPSPDVSPEPGEKPGEIGDPTPPPENPTPAPQEPAEPTPPPVEPEPTPVITPEPEPEPTGGTDEETIEWGE